MISGKCTLSFRPLDDDDVQSTTLFASADMDGNERSPIRRRRSSVSSSLRAGMGTATHQAAMLRRRGTSATRHSSQGPPELSDRLTRWSFLNIHPFRGMVNDLRARLPYYASDWKDAWTYRVIPSTIDTYFKK